MGNALLGLLAVLCFYIGVVYLFKRDLAARWDASRRRALSQSDLLRDARWEASATRRGVFAIIAGVILLAIMTGVL
jgi:hypothetical protein